MKSDMLENALDGLCKDCMVLQAKAEITDGQGIRMDLKNDIYVHHIIIADMARGMTIAPVVRPQSSCPGRTPGAGVFGGLGGMSTPKEGKAASSGGHSHSKRDPQTGAMQSFGIPMWSLFIAKGNEGDTSLFSPLNTTLLKSGYWIGKGDKVTATAEVVNYKKVHQDIYLSIDMEYVEFNGPRPAEYLDVAFGSIQVEQCGDLYLRKTAQELERLALTSSQIRQRTSLSRTIRRNMLLLVAGIS
jgi:hypothetical protein